MRLWTFVLVSAGLARAYRIDGPLGRRSAATGRRPLTRPSFRRSTALGSSASPRTEDAAAERWRSEQWGLYTDNHCGEWNCAWTTYDAMGDVLDEVTVRSSHTSAHTYAHRAALGTSDARLLSRCLSGVRVWCRRASRASVRLSSRCQCNVIECNVSLEYASLVSRRRPRACVCMRDGRSRSSRWRHAPPPPRSTRPTTRSHASTAS